MGGGHKAKNVMKGSCCGSSIFKKEQQPGMQLLQSEFGRPKFGE